MNHFHRLTERATIRRWSGIAVALLLTACASESPRKPVELPAITPEVRLELAWRLATGDSEFADLRPAVHGAALYIADARGRIGRYENDRPVWEIETKLPISGGVASDGDIVVAGTSKGEVLAYSAADGRALWRGRVSSEVLAPTAIAGDRVLVRSGDHRLFALDRRDGSRLWTMQRTTPPLTLRVSAPPVVAENLVFIGYPGGKLLAVSIDSGAVLWEGSVALPKGTTELERMADIAGAPVMGPKEVCAAAYQGRVACFDLSNGNLIWAQEVSSETSIAIDSGNIYVTDTDGLVRAYSRTDGKVVWTQEALKWRRLTAPLVRRGVVLVGDDKGTLHALRRNDGALVGRLENDVEEFAADPVVAGDLTLYQTRRAVLAIAVD